MDDRLTEARSIGMGSPRRIRSGPCSLFPTRRRPLDRVGVHENRRARIALLFHRFAELQLPAPTGRGLDSDAVLAVSPGAGAPHEPCRRRRLSPAMIELARQLNRYRIARIHLHRRDGARHAAAAIVSVHLFEHRPATCAVRPLRALPARVLPPACAGWSAGFQLPSHKQEQVDAEIAAMPDAARGVDRSGRAGAGSVAAGSELRSRSPCATRAITNGANRTWSAGARQSLARCTWRLDGGPGRRPGAAAAIVPRRSPHGLSL